MRVLYLYDDAARNVEITPDEGDLAAASGLQILSLWATIGRWADSLKDSHPGWTVGGVDPAPAGHRVDTFLEDAATGCGGQNGEDQEDACWYGD